MTQGTKVRKDELYAMERLAEHVGGAWQWGEDPPDAYLDQECGKVAVEISTLAQHVVWPGNAPVPRLTYDAGVVALVDELDEHMNSKDAQRYAVLVLESPLENRRKLKTELTRLLEDRLKLPEDSLEDLQIWGNRVRMTTHEGTSLSGKRVVAMIPNRFSSPDIAANAFKILKDRLDNKTEKMRAISKHHTCWLVLLNDYWLADSDTYRAAMAKLTGTHLFDAVYLVGQQGTVDRLDTLTN